MNVRLTKEEMDFIILTLEYEIPKYDFTNKIELIKGIIEKLKFMKGKINDD